jgi:hypothetical protein
MNIYTSFWSSRFIVYSMDIDVDYSFDIFKMGNCANDPMQKCVN